VVELDGPVGGMLNVAGVLKPIIRYSTPLRGAAEMFNATRK
jgi:hypothetical protein